MEHAISALVGLTFVAASVIGSYKLAKSFFGSKHSQTDTSGDFGTARGSFFAFLLPSMLCMGILFQVARILTIHFLGAYIIAVLVLGLSAAIYGAFSNKPAAKKEDEQTDGKPDEKKSDK